MTKRQFFIALCSQVTGWRKAEVCDFEDESNHVNRRIFDLRQST